MKKFNIRLLLSLVVGIGTVSTSFGQSNPAVIYDAANFFIRGCEVNLRVNGYSNQLFENGVFVGSYQSGSQDYDLAQRINQDLQRGICNYKSPGEINLLRDPSLISQFVHFQYQNCYVKPIGAYNQFYIRNTLIGNYVAMNEDAKLRSALAANVMNGTCIRANFPPPPPQFCTCTLINQWGNFRASGPNCQNAAISVVNQCANSNPHAVCSASQAVCR